MDVTLGYRYLQLNDNLGIREELTTTNYGDADPNANGSFLIQDSFGTRNQFHGGELGLVFQTRQGRWTMELAPKIALGTTQENVTINGSTTITNAAGVSTSYAGGLWLWRRTSASTSGTCSRSCPKPLSNWDTS